MHQCFMRLRKLLAQLCAMIIIIPSTPTFWWCGSPRPGKSFLFFFLSPGPVLLQSRLRQRAHQCAYLRSKCHKFFKGCGVSVFIGHFPLFFIPSSYLICICDSCKINGHIYTIQQIYDQSHACFNIRNTVHRCKEIFVFGKSLLCILKMKMLQNYLDGIYFHITQFQKKFMLIKPFIKAMQIRNGR